MEVEFKDGLPVLSFATTEAFAEWVEAHVAEAGLWLKIAKKDSGEVTINYLRGWMSLCVMAGLMDRGRGMMPYISCNDSLRHGRRAHGRRSM